MYKLCLIQDSQLFSKKKYISNNKVGMPKKELLTMFHSLWLFKPPTKPSAERYITPVSIPQWVNLFPNLPFLRREADNSIP